MVEAFWISKMSTKLTPIFDKIIRFSCTRPSVVYTVELNAYLEDYTRDFGPSIVTQCDKCGIDTNFLYIQTL